MALAASLQLGLAIVLGWAAFAKVRAPGEVAASLQQLLAVSPRIARLSLIAIVAAESLCSLALIFDPDIGAPVAVAVFGAFALITSLLLASGVRGSCGCFGASSTEPMTPLTSVRAALLALIAAWLIVGNIQTGSVPLEPLAWLNGLGFAVVIRLMPDLGVAYLALRQRAPEARVTRRQSFRYVPVTESLFRSASPSLLDGTNVPISLSSLRNRDQRAPRV